MKVTYLGLYKRGRWQYIQFNDERIPDTFYVAIRKEFVIDFFKDFDETDTSPMKADVYCLIKIEGDTALYKYHRTEEL